MTASMAGTNWAGNLSYHARAVHRVTSLEHLAELVTTLPRARALGSRHCFNDLADTDADLLDVGELDGAELDPETRTVAVGAGTRYGVLAQRLHGAGWALANMASLPHISVAGAMATGTHGSGDRNPILPGSVRSFDLLTAEGAVRRLDRGEPDFAGALIGLGALGVVTRLELDVEPTYLMRQDVYGPISWERVLTDFDHITAAGHSVSLIPLWPGDSGCLARVKTRGTTAPEEVGGAPRTREGLPTQPGMTDWTGETGPWLERLPHFRLGFEPSFGDELQSEYLIDRRDAPAALEELRGLGELLAPYQHGTEIRTMCADDFWLSPAYGRDTVGIHVTWRKSANVDEALPVLEERFAPFSPRPHWGKLTALPVEAVRAANPRLGDFAALRDRLDPERRFTNAFVDRLLG